MFLLVVRGGLEKGCRQANVLQNSPGICNPISFSWQHLCSSHGKDWRCESAQAAQANGGAGAAHDADSALLQEGGGASKTADANKTPQRQGAQAAQSLSASAEQANKAAGAQSAVGDGGQTTPAARPQKRDRRLE